MLCGGALPPCVSFLFCVEGLLRAMYLDVLAFPVAVCGQYGSFCRMFRRSCVCGLDFIAGWFPNIDYILSSVSAVAHNLLQSSSAISMD